MKQTALVQKAFDFTNKPDYVPYVFGNIDNIRLMLPQLYPEQQEDVLHIELRFKDEKGYLCTNGTGTGKTFTGLGVVKRFLAQNKRNILIVVPTDAKCVDWIKEARLLDIDIYQLQSTIDRGHEVRVTTYANFYQNDFLYDEDFDLIIYDESHYLNQNQQGTSTSCLEKHQQIAKLPNQVRSLVAEMLEHMRPREDDLMPVYYEKNKAYLKKHLEMSLEMIDHTKVLFLSATPFAYHKSLKYGDGCIFEISQHRIEKKEEYAGYNTPTGFEKFLVENFGYRMRYNKVTYPEKEVDVSLLERAFFEFLVEKGAASTRMIDVPVDYSREFFKVDSAIGEQIDKGIDLFYTSEFEENYKILSEFVRNQFDYLYTNQLLECIKAQRIEDRINDHLYLDRKIVIFHTYNHARLKHPFKFGPHILPKDKKYLEYTLQRDIENFENDYPDLANMDLSSLRSVPDTIKDLFPEALIYNGTVSKKKRKEAIALFNNPNSGKDIIVVQTKAGREGISLHDTFGYSQRVIVNLGLPVAPTQAIQEEGRIYRLGALSNAIYEYITLQTSFERMSYADKIARRARTAENLAMGNLARDLETAFTDGYINYRETRPNIGQGRKGKQSDRQVFNVSEWDKAITFYFKRGKVNSKRKHSQGGIDFFATPEPLGMKMVQWLDMNPGDSILEPSAGVGSISRFFPSNTNNVIIEPHMESASIADISTSGEVKVMRFEDYYVGNKYEGIVMNPPFGRSGKIAMEHLQKACRHLPRKGGFLYCIVPNGPAMQKRLDQFFYDDPWFSKELLVFAGEMILPNCVFERTGTQVSTKIVKIIKRGVYSFDRLHISREDPIPIRNLDFSHYKNINDFFDAIEHLIF